jgi:lysophospholipase L1-like esterase
MKYDADDNIDVVVVQLSTNDATSGGDLGELSSATTFAEIDSTTYTGGMEAVIAYAKETLGCEILIYSNPEFRHDTGMYEPEAYDEMVQQTKKIAEKWDVDFLNMWEDEECKAVTDKQWKLWMGDAVHPTRAGYLEWWTPMFQEVLYSYFE